MSDKELTDSEKISASIKEDNLKEVSKRLEELKPLLESDRVNIKESVFKTHFLPLFTKEIELNEENMRRFTHNFLIVTDSLFIPISVVDDNSNEVLFTMPPMMLSMESDGLTKDISFSKLLNKYKTLKDNTNPLGDKLLDETTSFLKKTVKPSEDTLTKYITNLDIIYKRYGIYDKEEIPIEEKIESSDNIKEEINDIFDYDD